MATDRMQKQIMRILLSSTKPAIKEICKNIKIVFFFLLIFKLFFIKYILTYSEFVVATSKWINKYI